MRRRYNLFSIISHGSKVPPFGLSKLLLLLSLSLIVSKVRKVLVLRLALELWVHLAGDGISAKRAPEEKNVGLRAARGNKNDGDQRAIGGRRRSAAALSLK